MISLRRYNLELGAITQPDGSTRFLIWAPKSSQVELHLLGYRDRLVPMRRFDRGYWGASVEDAPAGTRYFFRHDGRDDWPDPASRSQPDGVHGASEVVDPSTFPWSATAWRLPSSADQVIYEVHVGTFTERGTFDSAIEELDRLARLGVTTLEIMPVAEFPGDRNWGYDGAYPFAAQSSYGGPLGLARLVDACHRRGLAVMLDVVYNHLGPEGAYAAALGDYFADRYRTPWGSAINFDGPGSDEVRRYFIESAIYWLRDLRIDGFRLDAVHAIHDRSASPFLREFTRTLHHVAQELGRTAYLVAESDLNDPRIIQAPSIGGYGFDAQWSDDLHHALHAILTGEDSGYYQDFGGLLDLKHALERGFVFAGQYSKHRGRSHGSTPTQVRPEQLVVCSQNHDQVGNRAIGDRLGSLISCEQLKLAAATVILSIYTPLLFMGEEYGESAPFQYFTSHLDTDLIDAVRSGRKSEFAAFDWSVDVPDPQDPATFARSKLHPDERNTPVGTALQDFYCELIRLRRELPALHDPDFSRQDVRLTGDDDSVVLIRRWNQRSEAHIVLNFSETQQTLRIPGHDQRWKKMLDSSDSRWSRPGASDGVGDRLSSGTNITLLPNSVLVLQLVQPERQV